MDSDDFHEYMKRLELKSLTEVMEMLEARGPGTDRLTLRLNAPQTMYLRRAVRAELARVKLEDRG